MKTVSKIFLMGLMSMCYTFAHGQETAQMADGMRSDGKIYVVVAIILTILFGFAGYLFFLDRKIAKIEKQISSKSDSR